MKTSVSLLPWAFEGLWLLMLLRMVYIFSPRWNFAPPCTRWQSIEHNIARVRLKATVYYRHIEVDLILTPHMSNVTEQSFSASPSARAFTIRTLETSALKFSTTLTLLLSSWNTITGSVGISTKKMKWNSENGESPHDKNTHSTKMRENYETLPDVSNFRYYKQWHSLLAARYNYDGSTLPWKCHVPNAFKRIGYFSWAVTRVDCNQSLFSQSVSRVGAWQDWSEQMSREGNLREAPLFASFARALPRDGSAWGSARSVLCGYLA